MTISAVSKKYNISADTLRYYEKIGLLRNITRNSGGLRDYSEENCRSVEFIKCMRSAGVSIETLTKYIELLSRGESTMEERKLLLIEQRNALNEKLKNLQDTIARLDFKIEHYEEIMTKKS